MSAEKPIIQSAEKKYLINSDEIAKMSMEVMNFQDPLSQLRIIKDTVSVTSNNILEEIDQFALVFKKILQLLKNNEYKIAQTLPPDFITLMNDEVSEDEVTKSMVSVLRAVGYTKNDLRKWVLDSFSGIRPDETDLEQMDIKAVQARQLQILEKTYESE